MAFSVVIASSVTAHHFDPLFLGRAGEQLARELESPTGQAALERACQRITDLALERITMDGRDSASKTVIGLLSRELLEDLRRGSRVDEVAEVLLAWGTVDGPTREERSRIVKESLSTFQMLRRVRAMFKRQFQALECHPPDLPRDLVEKFQAAPLAQIEKLRRKWISEVLPKSPPKSPVSSAIQRFDADHDGYGETRAVDTDLDGSIDRFEADLDGDRVFETYFLPSGSTWLGSESAPTPAPQASAPSPR